MSTVRRRWVRDMVHLFIMGVLLNMEVVVVVNLIVRVVLQTVWVVGLFVIVRVLKPVHLLFRVMMVWMM